jgi:hypothetical protein
MADIYFSDLNRKTVYQLPILPEDMPELSISTDNEEFETFNSGTYNFLNMQGLTTFSVESFLPSYAGKYSFAKSKIDSYTLINFWNSAMTNKTPIRCIMDKNLNSNTNLQIVNMMVSVEGLTYHEDTVGDVYFKLDLKEYRSVS